MDAHELDALWGAGQHLFDGFSLDGRYVEEHRVWFQAGCHLRNHVAGDVDGHSDHNHVVVGVADARRSSNKRDLHPSLHKKSFEPASHLSMTAHDCRFE